MNSPSRLRLGALFFLFGFGLIAWVPRFHEIEHNLNVGNGEFGTLLSVSAVGSLVALVSTGQLVHRYGAKIMLIASATLLFGSIALIVHLTSTWQFLLCNIAFGAGMSAFHISVNSQGLHEQESAGDNLIPRLHGLWSVGALSSAILSGFLVGKVPLVIHIDLLCAALFLAILFLINKLGTALIPANSEVDEQYSIRTLFSSFKIDWVMSLGLTCAAMLEMSNGDWSALFSNQELHMTAGISAIPYIIFIIAMIIGRLFVHRVTRYVSITRLIKTVTLIGGLSFILSTQIGRALSTSHPIQGLIVFTVGSFFGGLGVSFLAPIFMHAANKRSSAPGSVVIGRQGAVNTVLAFVCRAVIAWTAQLTSIGVALVIPSLMLMAVALSAKSIERAAV